MSAESIGQTAFPGVASPRDAKPTHPGISHGKDLVSARPRVVVCALRKMLAACHASLAGLTRTRA